MKRQLVFDIANIFNALIISILSVYFAYFGFPLWVQLSPFILIVVPLVILLHRRQIEKGRIKTQKNLSKAEKIRTLLVKLERISDIHNTASSLTHSKQFMDDQVASLGWRKYFDRHGRSVYKDFSGFGNNLTYLIVEGYKSEKSEDFFNILLDFYDVVSSFRHLYDDLAEMIQFGGKIPKEQIKNIQELEANHSDFLRALRDSCDEDEEIGRVFGGKYALVEPIKKLTVRPEPF